MQNKLYTYEYDGEPIPPGPSILETAVFHGITKEEIAVRTGYSVPQVEGVLNGDLPVTEEFATLLERILGMPAACLLRFEKKTISNKK